MAEHRRVRRLFGVLDDVAYYTAGYASTKMLAHVWDRISDLLHQAEDITIQAAVRRVAGETVGSPGWWRAICDVARVIDQHCPLPAGGSA